MDFKVAILIIATGKYSSFVNNLYNSCEEFFLPKISKDYYVFSDTISSQKDNIMVISQSHLGWPYDTMFRFKFFNSISDKLSKYDFLYFLNANMEVISVVGSEILPIEESLVGVIHPGYYTNDVNEFPYERRTNSQFYIPRESGKHYYQGCFIGGKSNDFLEMSLILDRMVDVDLSNNIIPIWHDESALNWYYLNKNPLSLNSSYSYPEALDLPFEKKIVQLDKSRYGGHSFLRSNI